ncbi:hypothetical protein [Citrobacter cronae]|uniref:hypothetical protein n=1 Tax=Citrobacter cronae TaxID=1748967 RepID=UPI0021D0184A|nr:hypothetical protein [Citrobacter cronae]MCU6177094.1 hypothetical protein [Citrobacter cronae]
MGYSKYLFIKILILCIIVSFQTEANNLIIMKYEYGKRGWDGTKYEQASIHPLSNKYFRYSTSDFENISTKRKLNITFDLFIKKEKKSILSTIIFKNNGDKSIFIPEISFSALSMNLLITTDNVMLEYLGGQFDYRGDFERTDWIEVLPEEMISLTQVLNDSYEFLPGKLFYSISSLEYTVVNEKWFTDRTIYNSFISIVVPEINDCHIKKNATYVFKKREMCIFDVKKKVMSLRDLLEKFGFHNVNDLNSFKIRTNQVSVEIDGNKVRSFYELN